MTNGLKAILSRNLIFNFKIMKTVQEKLKNTFVAVPTKASWEKVMQLLESVGDKFGEKFIWGDGREKPTEYEDWRFDQEDSVISIGFEGESINHQWFEIGHGPSYFHKDCGAKEITIQQLKEILEIKKNSKEEIIVSQEKQYKSTHGTIFTENMLCINEKQDTPEGWRKYVKKINKALQEHEKTTF